MAHLTGCRVALAALLGAFSHACGDDAPERELLLLGTVEHTFVEIAAPAAEVLREIAVARDEHVEAGARVAQLDATLAAADLASAEATVAAARATLSMASEEEQRARRLRASNVTSQQQLERAMLALEEARARTREAEARREAAAKRLADHTLHAPVTGAIAELPFELGERVPAGAVIAVVAADSAPWVRVWIPERAVSRVARGAPAQVRIDGLGTLRGRVSEIAREPEYTPHYALTERERGYLVYESRIRIEDAPSTLRAGVGAEVTLPLAPPSTRARAGMTPPDLPSAAPTAGPDSDSAAERAR
jgi:HlyD family secretion protein